MPTYFPWALREVRFAGIRSYFPTPADYHYGPHEYANHLYRVTQAVKIPVIASLNGIAPI